MAVLGLDDLAQRAEVAVHREDRLGDDDDPGVGVFGADAAQQPVELRGVVVREDADRRAGKAGTVDQAGVAKLVEHQHVVLSRQRGQATGGGGEAGGEDQRGLRALGGGERFFQLAVGRQGAADQSRGCRAGAEFPDALDEGLRQRRMRSEPEVVVRREIPQLAAGTDHPRAGGGIERAQGPQQPGVRQFREFLPRVGHAHGWAAGRSSAQRRSFSESFQMLAELLFRATTMAERPFRVPELTRQRPARLVVPVFRPSQ